MFLKVQDSHVQVACPSMPVRQLTDAFCSPPCRKDDDVSGSVGGTAVGAGKSSATIEFVSPPVRKEVLPTPLDGREWENEHREEPTTWQGKEARRLYVTLTSTGRDDIARQLMHDFEEAGHMSSESLRQYSSCAQAPSQRGEVGSGDEHTASPNGNTRNMDRNAGSSSSSWPKREKDEVRTLKLRDKNTAAPVGIVMSNCQRGCGSTFKVHGVPTKDPPELELQKMRIDLVTQNRTELRNLLYSILRHEGVSHDSSGPEVSVAKKGATHMMFTVKTNFFAAQMCLHCISALFLVSSRL